MFPIGHSEYIFTKNQRAKLKKDIKDVKTDVIKPVLKNKVSEQRKAEIKKELAEIEKKLFPFNYSLSIIKPLETGFGISTLIKERI